MYAVHNAASTAYDTAIVTSATQTSCTTTIDIPDNGVVIAASFAGNSGGGFPKWSSWTGVDQDRVQDRWGHPRPRLCGLERCLVGNRNYVI